MHKAVTLSALILLSERIFLGGVIGHVVGASRLGYRRRGGGMKVGGWRFGGSESL